MKRSVKMALATSVLAVAGGLFLVGSGYADGRFGPGSHHMGPRGMMGPMGGFGAMGHQILGDADANGDGKLSQEEIDAAINARFEQFDADKNGALSLDEFEALWADLTKPAAVRAFQFLDPNGDSTVSKDEAEEMFGHMVERFDRNDDGALSSDDRPRHRMGRDRGHGPRFGWGRGDGPRDGVGPAFGPGDGPRDGSGPAFGPGDGPRDGSGPRGRWIWQPETDE